MATKIYDHDSEHRGFFDLTKQEIRNVRLQNLGADIGTPVDGLIFYRTDTFKVRVRINGAWQDMATMADVTAGGISSSIVDAKGDLIVGSADNTVVRKAAGADGTFLVAASGQADGLQWRVIADADLPATITRDTEVFLLSGYTTKGDIAAATGAGAVSRLGVGANNTFLVGNSAQATGLEYRALLAADLAEKIATADLTDWPRTAALDLNGQKLTGVADGTVATDGATYGQLLAITEAKVWKDPVDAATTAALPALTYSSGAGTLTATANGALGAQDGITLAANDSLLVKNQASTFQNGLYTVTQVGTVGTPFILTRRTDASTAAELIDATVMVEAGTTQGGDIYTQTAAIADLTAAAQTWAKTGDTNTVYTADGTTITLTGNSFGVTAGGIGATQLAAAVAGNGLTGGAGSALAVNVDGTTIEVNADTVRLAATAAGNGLTGGGGAALAVGAGVGISVAADAVAVDTAVVVRKASGALTGGATSEVVTHNLNTRDVRVVVRNQNSPWDSVDVIDEATTVNTVTIRAATNLPAGYRWMVEG